MKKQNAMNKLAFTKAAVTELNGTQLSQINGGTGITGQDTDTNPCSGCCCDPITDKLNKLTIVQY
ncbi:class I lanthipeptide [Flavobacterium sp.]|uniref:class I lanthipeptide n=1 Tax=Flavobacterium sp. TaxID=239 RepID=UPI0037504106